ncbi:hypothetical protein [Streptomyces sp. NPDC002587]
MRSKKSRKSLMVGAMAALAVLGMAVPAQAQSDTCNVGGNACTTDSIPANSAGHYIRWGVENAAWDDSNYEVKDSQSGVVVARGYIGTGNARTGTVYGLYGNYELRVWNSSWDTFGWIDNDQ